MLLALLALACSVNAAAIYPRQAVDQLSVGWGTGGEEAGNIYLSNAKYTCGPCPIVLAGNYPPFSIDAVSFPYSEENQTVLTTVVTDWQSNAFDWYPVLAVDTVFALRITDGRNNTALSVEKTVKEGNGGWGCEMTTAESRRYNKQVDLALGCGLGLSLGGVFGLFCLTIVCAAYEWPRRCKEWYRRRFAACAAWRQRAAAAPIPAPVPAPTPALPAPAAPALLTAVAGARGARTASMMTQPPPYREMYEAKVRGEV